MIDDSTYQQKNKKAATSLLVIPVDMTIRKGFVFLGAAGVGKGTFAGIICKRTGWDHFSTGYVHIPMFIAVNFSPTN